MAGSVEPWTGDDGLHNIACGKRWPSYRSTGAPDYRDEWYSMQCGGCRFWIALQGGIGRDWGACTNPEAAFDRQLRFEHDGCESFAVRGDGSFG